jgi:RNA polymerase sigma-70 factor (ECF subfamily)
VEVDESLGGTYSGSAPGGKEASDEQLVFAISQLNEGALAEAYRRHSAPALVLGRRLLWDGGLAEDVVQEVFVKLWSEPGRFDAARGSLRSFLLAQTYNRSVDMLRSESARRAREEREARTAARVSADVEHHVVDIVLAERVRAALIGIPNSERRAIELAYFKGHTYRHVACVLGEAEGTVKSRIRAGLKRMRSNQDLWIGPST